MMILIFIISIAVLLLCIMKFKLNPFVALLVVAALTGLATGMPLATKTLEDGTQVLGIGTVIQNNFGSTLGSIGMVTGLGVMLGMFMYESGGINNICNAILKVLGEEKSQYAVACAGFITGIPVFGDVVYIMFAPMLRALSKKTGYSMAAYAGAISVATTCTFALVLPTAPPLAVAANMEINVGLFFPYALISAFVGMLVGGIVYGGFINKIDRKNGKTWDFSDLEEEEKEEAGGKSMSGMMALSILLVPIVLILLGSFSSFFLKEGTVLTVLTFLGDKNIAMLLGVLYGAFISRPYLKRSITTIMSEGADAVGSILLITGAGGAYGGIAEGLWYFRCRYQHTDGIPYANAADVLRDRTGTSYCYRFYNHSTYCYFLYRCNSSCNQRCVTNPVCNRCLCRWYRSVPSKRLWILGNQQILPHRLQRHHRWMVTGWFRSRCNNPDLRSDPEHLPGSITRTDVMIPVSQH